MKLKRYQLLLAFLLPLGLWAQNSITIQGKVTDASEGSPVPGVNILIKGTANGTTSDGNGSYTLSVMPTDVLIVSSIGFKTQEVQVGNRTVVDIQIINDVTQLGDVVVVGYGTLEKKDLTGSIASINNKDFKDQPTTNLAQNLQGKMAGVNITTTSGTPGASLNVSIRGASNPLYVVDGIPMLSESNSTMSASFDLSGTPVGSGQSISSISDINPNDIESIEVLKDASAAAIYGSRAANGVVMITTKRANRERPNLILIIMEGCRHRPEK